MIKDVTHNDIENMRVCRNKWQRLGIFRQAVDITADQQQEWFDTTLNKGFIINGRAWGKVYSSGEVSFYGFDTWLVNDIKEIIKNSKQSVLHGECYLNNPFLGLWLDAGFKVVNYKSNRKCYQGRMWDGLELEYQK